MRKKGMDHRTEEEAMFCRNRMNLGSEDAALDFSRMNILLFEDEFGLRVRRVRSQSISSPTAFTVLNAVTTSVHLLVHTLAVLISSSTFRCASLAHRGHT
jgi:hypothetical protein